MGLFERVVRALIYLCVVGICFFLCIWVLGMLGVALPAMVLTLLKVIFVLVALLVLVRLFYPVFSGYSWWGDGPGPDRRF